MSFPSSSALSRRLFLQQSALALTASSLPSLLRSADAPAAATALSSTAVAGQRLVFTKGLTHWPYERVAEAVAGLRDIGGITGIEAPIRPKGHMEPEQIPDKLPELMAALKKHQLDLGIMTSAITEADAAAEKQLRVAGELGIKRFRMGWYKYDLKRPILPQLEEAGKKLRDLIALAAECKIQPLYQIHSGNNSVGAPVWDICQLLRDIPVERCGLAFDIMHATIEGGMSWPIQARLALPHAGALYFKDTRREGDKFTTCPLGTGSVNWKSYLALLREQAFAGPVSLHVEYVAEDQPEKLVEAMRTDAATFKRLLEGEKK